MLGAASGCLAPPVVALGCLGLLGAAWGRPTLFAESMHVEGKQKLENHGNENRVDSIGFLRGPASFENED